MLLLRVVLVVIMLWFCGVVTGGAIRQPRRLRDKRVLCPSDRVFSPCGILCAPYCHQEASKRCDICITDGGCVCPPGKIFADAHRLHCIELKLCEKFTHRHQLNAILYPNSIPREATTPKKKKTHHITSNS